MGMRRLSIIDVEKGNQPFYSQSRQIVVMCNGEIYNHKEIVDMKKIVYTKDSFLIKSPVFEGYIKAKKSSVGMEGYFFNNSLDRKIKFKAYPGHERFKLKNSSIIILMSLCLVLIWIIFLQNKCLR